MTAIVAHRGASADHPENTERAFEHALCEPPRADGFECDVRLSADGVPYVFHDDDTRRLTGQTGTIEGRTAAEIDALRVSGEAIPTLSTLLRLVTTHASAPLVLNIELKPTGDPAPLIAACGPLLEAIDSRHELVVSSFDPRVLAAAMAVQVPWRLAFLYEARDALRFLNLLDPQGHLDLHPRHDLIDAAHLRAYRTSPFDGQVRRIRTWTVDDLDEARRLKDLGVDAIITNTPQLLKRSLLTP